ncbi:unnamed protein product [Acanthoscelides obtectus]|uniref:Uncharacterized protein n=1 Tax=Acanthoscelides obtectus TaxID=200917 RepID=A0A9P0MBM1_ACAOB|nr:unnamed protein product [Acanthoscelides obtectus]CAK1624243.1 hypothetical protein AOBTE_LOCUS2436 [Acanthoscelides obtectus]
MLQANRHDKKAFIKLVETVYCRILLLNRRRPGELQRLLLNTYTSAFNNENKQAYEEFSEVISATERCLTNSFKRIVIKGKRNRGVPVLIRKDISEHLNIILKCRKDVVQKETAYLFTNPDSGDPIVAYKVLRKYATLCGAKKSDALTCTRLRKHLATLTQLFNMNENDMEQLASLMGHTLGIHRSSCRLPDDVYQTAKISKLLILMEQVKAGEFKGKSLDEINLNLEEDLMEIAGKDKDMPSVLDIDNNETTSTQERSEIEYKKYTEKNKEEEGPGTMDRRTKKVVNRFF